MFYRLKNSIIAKSSRFNFTILGAGTTFLKINEKTKNIFYGSILIGNTIKIKINIEENNLVETSLLEIEGIKSTGKPTYIIKEQLFINRGFFFAKSIFTCKNGIKLASMDSPEWKKDEKTLYVRGDRKENDLKSFIIEDEEDYLKIKEAINEYNKEFEKIMMGFV